MSLRTKSAAAVVGALAIVLVAPTPAFAKSRPNTYRFTGGTIPSNVNVTCAQGATTGTTAVKLKVKATRKFSNQVTPEFIGDSLGRSTKFVATYPGGRTNLTRFERLYTINPGKSFRFPCPNTAVGGTSTFTIVIQPYRGNKPIGTSAKVNVTLHRVGFGS
jgi:hypothetical protein